MSVRTSSAPIFLAIRKITNLIPRPRGGNGPEILLHHVTRSRTAIAVFLHDLKPLKSQVSLGVPRVLFPCAAQVKAILGC